MLRSLIRIEADRIKRVTETQMHCWDDMCQRRCEDGETNCAGKNDKRESRWRQTEGGKVRGFVSKEQDIQFKALLLPCSKDFE